MNLLKPKHVDRRSGGWEALSYAVFVLACMAVGAIICDLLVLCGLTATEPFGSGIRWVLYPIYAFGKIAGAIDHEDYTDLFRWFAMFGGIIGLFSAMIILLFVLKIRRKQDHTIAK